MTLDMYKTADASPKSNKPGMNLSARQRKNLLMSQLRSARAQHEPVWQDIGDYILPDELVIFSSSAKSNRGDRRDQNIIDCTVTNAVQIATAGLTSGIANPSTDWMEVAVDDERAMEDWAVQKWCQDVTHKMMSLYQESNLYQAIPYLWKNCLGFGTAAAFVDEDTDDGMRVYTMPVGSFFIGNDSRRRVRVFAREVRWTVRQLIEKFGYQDDPGEINWDRFSDHVKIQYDAGHLENEVDCIHIVEQNPEWNPDALESKYKKYLSCYYETGVGAGASVGTYISDMDEGRFLEVTGYDYWPVLAPRWGVSADSAYGTSWPCRTALGDAKQLQNNEVRIGLGMEKELNPPMTSPTHLRNPNTLPGGVTLIDARGGDGFRPAYQIAPRIESYEAKQEQTRMRIKDTLMVNMFLQMTQSTRREITAREVEERHAEKLSVLGPVLEQWNDDLFDPLTEIAFHILMKRGEIDPAPEAIQGRPIRVRYTSVMAKAQRLVALPSIERFTGFVGQIGQVNPGVFQKINTDKLVEIHARLTGIPVDILRPQEEVEAARAAQAQAQAAQMQAEQQNLAAKSAHLLAGSDTSGKNALTDVASAMAEQQAVA